MHAESDVVYLKPSVKLEALVCRWYAWAHLISPVQLSLHVAFRMLPLLKSFATNPSVHWAASRDKAMFGGPFVSLAEEQLPAVRELLDETNATCAKLVALAADLRRVSGELPEKASGFSLNDLYAQLPATLSGLVEFLYDTNNHASLRLFEDLVYDEYDVSSLQEIVLEEIADDNRHFFMSTPRPVSPRSLSMKMKFSDKRLDALAAMRTRAGSFQEIADLFGQAGEERAKFRNFFTEAPLASENGERTVGEGVRMRFFGHACVLLQTRDVSVLFDPFVAIEPGDDGRLTMADLPDVIDYVVLTHAHQDHFNAEMLLQLRHKVRKVIVPTNNAGSVADPSMRLVLREMGFDDVKELGSFEEIALPNGRLLSLPFTGEHADLNIHSKHAICLELDGTRSLFLIDSDGRDPMMYERIARRLGKIDALFIGMECHGAPLNWLYEPLLNKPLNRRNNESRRLSGADCDRAWGIISVLKPSRVFIYAMGQEPWMKYIMGLQYAPDSIQLVESNKLLERCLDAGIPAERLKSGRNFAYDR